MHETQRERQEMRLRAGTVCAVNITLLLLRLHSLNLFHRQICFGITLL